MTLRLCAGWYAGSRAKRSSWHAPEYLRGSPICSAWLAAAADNSAMLIPAIPAGLRGTHPARIPPGRGCLAIALLRCSGGYVHPPCWRQEKGIDETLMRMRGWTGAFAWRMSAVAARRSVRADAESTHRYWRVTGCAWRRYAASPDHGPWLARRTGACWALRPLSKCSTSLVHHASFAAMRNAACARCAS